VAGDGPGFDNMKPLVVARQILPQPGRSAAVAAAAVVAVGEMVVVHDRRWHEWEVS